MKTDEWYDQDFCFDTKEEAEKAMREADERARQPDSDWYEVVEKPKGSAIKVRSDDGTWDPDENGDFWVVLSEDGENAVTNETLGPPEWTCIV